MVQGATHSRAIEAWLPLWVMDRLRGEVCDAGEVESRDAVDNGHAVANLFPAVPWAQRSIRRTKVLVQ
jgi:hypothetical protein